MRRFNTAYFCILINLPREESSPYQTRSEVKTFISYVYGYANGSERTLSGLEIISAGWYRFIEERNLETTRRILQVWWDMTSCFLLLG